MTEEKKERVIALRPNLVKKFGSSAGIALSQYIWLSENTADEHGWFKVTQDDFEEMTGLSKRIQRTVNDKLETAQVLQRICQGLFGTKMKLDLTKAYQTTLHNVTVTECNTLQNVTSNSDDMSLQIVTCIEQIEVTKCHPLQLIDSCILNTIGGDIKASHLQTLNEQNGISQKAVQEMYQCLLTVTKGDDYSRLDLSMMPDSEKSAYMDAATKAVERDKLPDDFYEFAFWFRNNDWRGRKGEPPTLKLISELWATFRKAVPPSRWIVKEPEQSLDDEWAGIDELLDSLGLPELKG